MSDIDFRTFNLNLVPALAALLQEGTVGAAAKRVGVSQSAMSHSLAKLREQLSDPILVTQGRRVSLTPRAQRLAAQLPAVLDELRETLSGPSTFSPSAATLTWRIATVDYFELTTLPSLIAYLREHAPGVTLVIERLTAASGAALQAGRLDLILGGTGLVRGSGIEMCELYRDPFKVIVRADHPRLRRRPTLRQYVDAEHVVVRFEGSGPGLVDRVLAQRKLERRVGLWVPHFVSAPLVVADSEMISTVASAVAERGRRLLGLRVFEPPIPLPSAPVTMWWPKAHERDPARTWLRELIGRGVAAPPAIRRRIKAAASEQSANANRGERGSAR